MTAGEIAVLVPLGISSLGSMIALIKLTMNGKSKKTSIPPPPDHGPCNEAVDRLCTVTEKLVEKIDKSNSNFEKWMAKEEGRREALRGTGEYPVPGGV